MIQDVMHSLDQLYCPSLNLQDNYFVNSKKSQAHGMWRFINNSEMIIYLFFSQFVR